MPMNRRDFLKNAAASAALLSLPLISRAASPVRGRVVVVGADTQAPQPLSICACGAVVA